MKTRTYLVYIALCNIHTIHPSAIVNRYIEFENMTLQYSCRLPLKVYNMEHDML